MYRRDGKEEKQSLFFGVLACGKTRFAVFFQEIKTEERSCRDGCKKRKNEGGGKGKTQVSEKAEGEDKNGAKGKKDVRGKRTFFH